MIFFEMWGAVELFFLINVMAITVGYACLSWIMCNIRTAGANMYYELYLNEMRGLYSIFVSGIGLHCLEFVHLH
jgi:hypothetical protein